MTKGYQPIHNNIGKAPQGSSGVPPIQELIIIIEKTKRLLGIDPCIESPNYEIAKAIQEAGYTKSSFPIEELKAWLEEMLEKSERLSKDENDNDIEFYCGGSAVYLSILAKIKELEDSK